MAPWSSAPRRTSRTWARRTWPSGGYTGFDIEIAKMVGAHLGFAENRVRFTTIASANRETALQNGQIDYYVGTYTINDNRKRLVGFAGPYYVAGQGLLVRSDEEDIKGPEDLDGKRVCSAMRLHAVPADAGGVPEGRARLLRHLLDLRGQPADLPGRRRHHRRRHSAGLRRQGPRGTEGRRQALLRGAVRHRGAALGQRAAPRHRRRPGGGGAQGLLEGGVRRDARPLRSPRAEAARHRPLRGLLRGGERP